MENLIPDSQTLYAIELRRIKNSISDLVAGLSLRREAILENRITATTQEQRDRIDSRIDELNLIIDSLKAIVWWRPKT